MARFYPIGGSGNSVYSSDLTAVNSNVLSGYTAMTNDSNDEIIVGTMKNNGAVSSALNCGESYTVAEGYHNGSGKITANSLSSQTSATATAARILAGYTAWVNGSKITGTVAVQSILSFSTAPYSSTQITFTWKNPAKGPFSGVIIVGKIGSYPTGISDGTRWYKGSGNNTTNSGTSSTTVNGFTPGTAYYFRAFSYAIKNDAEWVGNTTHTAAATPSKGTKTFTSSGTFTVPAGVRSIDIFCVGGGGSSCNRITASSTNSNWTGVSAGGGGGYTATKKSYAVTPGQTFAVTIGAGGTSGGNGGTTSFGSVLSASGGTAPDSFTGQGNGSVSQSHAIGGNGGSGGAGGYGSYTSDRAVIATGGSDGTNGDDSNTNDSTDIYVGGKYYSSPTGSLGQHSTTRAFGESSGTLYSGGGGCGWGEGGAGGGGNAGTTQVEYIDYDDGEEWEYIKLCVGNPGAANTGGGGGGASLRYIYYKNSTNLTRTGIASAGGSGICIIRWGY